MVREFHSQNLPKASAVLPPLPDTNLDLEIGCGKGMHAIRYAIQNPNRHLLAIERTKDKFDGFMNRVESHRSKGLLANNLTPVFGDAIPILAHLVAGNEIFQNIFILYPNPYPKNSQKNKRFHFSPSMALILDKLKPGGKLILSTNLQWYADEAKGQYTSEWNMMVQTDEVIQPEIKSFRPRTHFEKKYLASGEACYNMSFKKN